MGTYWWFNAEVRRCDGWKIPDELPPKHTGSGIPIGGEFGWMRQNWNSYRLFFGDGAFFPFTRGRPPETSEFCRLWDDYQPDWDIDMEAHWIDFERLYIDLWDDPAVLMQSGIRARFASHFGDGSQGFPEAALRAAGATGDDFSQLRERAAPVSGAIDNVLGWDRFMIERIPPQDCVPVTWQASVNWMLPSCAAGFRKLRRLGNAADLRVIALLG
jgi:hypothetical protein